MTARCLELGAALRRGELLESSLQAVTRAAEELTRSDQSTLRLLDDSGQRLLTSARSGPSVHRRGNTPFRAGEGFIGWVVLQRRAGRLNAPARDQRFVFRSGQLWTPGALMAAPLMAGESCIGVLSTARRDGRPYSQCDLDLLRLVVQLSVPHLEIARLKRLNESDPLTLLHNRRHLQERLPHEVQAARRRGEPLAVVMIDLDRFKRVNDRHGHDAGDQVLQELAERLRLTSRTTDVVARLGGEEFLVVLPGSGLAQALQVAERLRSRVAEAPFQTAAGPLELTISLGVAELKPGEDHAALLHRADQALYRAKRAGRNRVGREPVRR